MDRTEQYRANAARALEALEVASDFEGRVRLLNLAKAWLLLANDAEIEESDKLPRPQRGLPASRHVSASLA